MLSEYGHKLFKNLCTVHHGPPKILFLTAKLTYITYTVSPETCLVQLEMSVSTTELLLCTHSLSSSLDPCVDREQILREFSLLLRREL